MKNAQILLLVDSPDSLTTIQKSLLNGGYSPPAIVYNVEDALQNIADTSPDIVIMTISSQDDGKTFATASRFRKEYGLPVICLCPLNERDCTDSNDTGYNCVFTVPSDKADDICSIVYNLLEKRPLGESIDENQEIFRLMIEDGSDMILLLDETGKIMYQSPSIHRILGYSMEELDGRHITEFIYFEDIESFYDSFSRFLQNPSHALPLEIRVFHKDGTLRIIEAKAKNFKRHASIRGVIANCRDITDRKKIEMELHKVQKLESLGILAGGIAHDFNNILTSIIGNIALIKMDTDPESEIFDSLSDAEKASYRARDLTHQLLTFSKGGAPVRKITSVAPILRDTASFSLHGSQIQCDIHIPPDLWHVDVDEGQISQVINNLLINAVQSMSESGRIRLDTGNISIKENHHPLLPDGDYVIITVIDQGSGIPASLLPKIFDPYFTTKRDGSGLGLSTAYSIIKNHGGIIDVESKPGAGSRFNVYIPRSQDDAPPLESSCEKTVYGEGKILLMDDDEQVLKITGKILSRIGYEVDTVTEGAEAFDYYSRAVDAGKPYDAIILDLTIRGGLSGKATLEAIRQIDPGVIAIVASGYANNPVMAEFGKFGFKAGIRKPYRVDELNEVLSSLLKNR